MLGSLHIKWLLFTASNAPIGIKYTPLHVRTLGSPLLGSINPFCVTLLPIWVNNLVDWVYHPPARPPIWLLLQSFLMVTSWRDMAGSWLQAARLQATACPHHAVHGDRCWHVHLALKPLGVQQSSRGTLVPLASVAFHTHTSLIDRNLPFGSSSCVHQPQTFLILIHTSYESELEFPGVHPRRHAKAFKSAGLVEHPQKALLESSLYICMNAG